MNDTSEPSQGGIDEAAKPQTETGAAPDRPRRRRYRGGLPIAGVLTIGVVVFVCLSLGLVVHTGYQIARLNTNELIHDKADLVIETVVERTRAQLLPVRAQAVYLTQLLEDLPFDQTARVGQVLQASLAGVPQVSTVGLVSPDLKILRAFRNRPEQAIQVSDWSDQPRFREAIERARGEREPYWGEMFVAEREGLTFINLFAPLHAGDSFLGALVLGVSTEELSDFLRAIMNTDSGLPFILSGKDHILAHPELTRGFPGLSDERPMPQLAAFGDPVLAQIWSSERRRSVEARFANAIQVRSVDIDGETYVFLYRELSDFGQTPWTVGTYFRFAEVAPQFSRLRWLAWIGLAVLAASLGVAIWFSRGLSEPIRQLGRAARQISALELDQPLVTPKSPFRELNETSAAFQSMVSGLRSFAAYVPQPLVRRLMSEPDSGTVSEEREITVMFTDIVGFTALAENMSPSELAGLLNHHFTLVERCVEAQEGIVDKYIGDSVMAFWGAPGEQPDHAERAYRAAQRIAVDMAEDNRARESAGLPPLRLRVGLHSGPAVVGNIGAPSRINYTVIGDTVNTAERLEALARTLSPVTNAFYALLSGSTAERLGPELSPRALGLYNLPGRQAMTEVYALTPDAQGSQKC
jgi:class 3 adenylate cyclase